MQQGPDRRRLRERGRAQFAQPRVHRLGRREPRPAHAPEFGRDRVAPGAKARVRVVADEAELAPPLAQAQVGVVLAQQQAPLGARGEHPVGLAGAAGDQVVDEDPEVGLRAVEDERRARLREAGRVDPGPEPLRRRLLVAGGAVDLAGEEEAADRLGLEGRGQLRRLHEVVLDRVGRPHDLGLLQARDAAPRAPPARRAGGSSRGPWRRSPRCRAPPARGAPGGAPSGRSASPCPRARGSSARRRR